MIEVVAVVAACVALLDAIVSEATKRSLALRLTTNAARLRSVTPTRLVGVVLSAPAQISIAILAGIFSAASLVGLFISFLGPEEAFAVQRSGQWLSFGLGFGTAITLQSMLLARVARAGRRRPGLTMSTFGALSILFVAIMVGLQPSNWLPDGRSISPQFAGLVFCTSLTGIIVLSFIATVLSLVLVTVLALVLRGSGWVVGRIAASPRGILAVVALILILVEKLVKALL